MSQQEIISIEFTTVQNVLQLHPISNQYFLKVRRLCVTWHDFSCFHRWLIIVNYSRNHQESWIVKSWLSGSCIRLPTLITCWGRAIKSVHEKSDEVTCLVQTVCGEENNWKQIVCFGLRLVVNRCAFPYNQIQCSNMLTYYEEICGRDEGEK